MAANKIISENLKIEILYRNIISAGLAATEAYPEYTRAKYFRIYIPKPLVEYLQAYLFGSKKVQKLSADDEGKLHICNFPIYFAITNEITIASIDLSFLILNPPMVKMTDFFTDTPNIHVH